MRCFSNWILHFVSKDNCLKVCSYRKHLFLNASNFQNPILTIRKSAVENPYERKDITVQSFAAYYKEMMNNDSEKIKAEFNAINFFADNLDKTSIASKANENLNRYLNISPYDSNRVVLNEDEFENDYINASFINVSTF